ncbi:MAG: hypothetical protein QOF60_1434 [Actinomycetota bacterium]|jgi:hypothetical protein|nr:hypothetical protein [Actinomycetota bacterium]
MNRTTLARRYAPLAALAAVQLLIIATVPSKAPAPAAEVAAGGPAAGSGGAGGETYVDPATGETIDSATGQVIDPSTGRVVSNGGTGPGAGATRTGTGATAGGGAGAGGTSGGGGTAAPVGNAGITNDTSHCVDGRQFDPKIFYYAPTCVGKWDPKAKNGSATYQGVTDKEVKVVVYRGKPNPQVEAILQAVGASPDPAWVTDFMKKSFEFINGGSFEFYGRKIVVDEVFGTCDTVPPDYVCLRGEMRDIVRDRKPFAVLWGTILASPAFDELSALKVVNVGGQHFRNNPFSIKRRPYHWDVAIPGDVAAKQVAEFYCKRLKGNGAQPYKAKYAGETAGQNPSQNDLDSKNPPNDDIRNTPRVLGVISTDDPENLNNIKQVLKPELAKCGATVQHEFYYAQDISRAEEQRRLGIAKMRESPEATSIMCFCDAVAPLFLYRTAQEEKYYPEHIVVGTGGNDSDAVGQSYDHGSTLCPDCRQYENAFGLRSIAQQERFTNNEATRLYAKMGGRDWPHGNKSTGGPLTWDDYKTAISDLNYYMLVATLIQGAGPVLTPANVEKGAFAQGSRGGFADINNPHLNRREFKPGNYGWFSDMDEVYWSQNSPSESMGKNGAYVQVSGRRYVAGEMPEGELQFPQAKPR